MLLISFTFCFLILVAMSGSCAALTCSRGY